MNGTHGQLAQMRAEVGPTTVVVPGPRRRDRLPLLEPLPEVGDHGEFLDLVGDHFDGVGDGANIPRLLAYLRTHPQPHPSFRVVVERAREVYARAWDIGSLSPRRHLASLILAWSGDPTCVVVFPGYRRLRTPAEPASVRNTLAHLQSPSRSGRHVDLSLVGGVNYGAVALSVPTHSPAALFAEMMGQAYSAIVRRHEGGMSLIKPPAASSPVWRRVVVEPGRGTHALDQLPANEPKPFWLHGEMPISSKRLAFGDVALDVSDVPAEFSYRAQSALEQDGFEQIVQWAGWLYRANPDTLAAHAHPMLWTATQARNVRGVGSLLAAIGSTRRILGDPSYSALALGLSAKDTDHRRDTAEAIASLALSGFLDPMRLAAQIGHHLIDGFVVAERVASALAETAKLRAIAGYRALQTLEELLPLCGKVSGGAKLMIVAARLAADFGYSVKSPELWADEPLNSPAFATALHALSAVAPTVTPLLVAAASEAEEAREDHPALVGGLG